MKYLNFFLVVTLCTSLTFGASVANGGIFDIIKRCHIALTTSISRNKSIKESIQLAFEKLKAQRNGIEFTGKQDETDLIQVAQSGYVNSVLRLARRHAFKLPLDVVGVQIIFTFYVNETDSNGMTALMHAAKNGHKADVINLVRVLALTDRKDKNGITASAHASANGHHDIAEMLIKDGDDLLEELGGLRYYY